MSNSVQDLEKRLLLAKAYSEFATFLSDKETQNKKIARSIGDSDIVWKVCSDLANYALARSESVATGLDDAGKSLFKSFTEDEIKAIHEILNAFKKNK